MKGTIKDVIKSFDKRKKRHYFSNKFAVPQTGLCFQETKVTVTVNDFHCCPRQRSVNRMEEKSWKQN